MTEGLTITGLLQITMLSGAFIYEQQRHNTCGQRRHHSDHTHTRLLLHTHFKTLKAFSQFSLAQSNFSRANDLSCNKCFHIARELCITGSSTNELIVWETATAKKRLFCNWWHCGDVNEKGRLMYIQCLRGPTQ
jgi:hypothetical protein